jgi:hypothetical protein
MIYADICGKNKVPEDVFTSNCLGLLGLLPDFYLLDFFAKSTNLRGELLTIPVELVKLKLDFWPYLPTGDIPDALLTIEIAEPTPSTFRLIIEVKHGAPKSGIDDNDQLAKYWNAANKLWPGCCVIVYLTHHRTIPKVEIEYSKGRASDEAKIYWLSWFDLYLWVCRQISINSQRPHSEKRILDALRYYLIKNDYRTFRGWNQLPSISIKVPYIRSYTIPEIPPVKLIYKRHYSASIISGVNRIYKRTYDCYHMTSGLLLSYKSC